MAKKIKPKKALKKATKSKKTEILIGISSNYSFDEALKDALSKAQELETDYYKYEVSKIEFEKGGIAMVENLIVTVKRTNPK